VEFENGLGVKTMPTLIFRCNVATNLPASTYTRAGYTQEGWTNAVPGGLWYANQGAVATDITTPGDTATLTALWEPISGIHVDYDPNDGTGVDESLRTFATYLSPYGTLVAAPDLAGQQFVGWFRGGARVESATLVNTWNAHVLYAFWFKAESPLYTNSVEVGAITSPPTYPHAADGTPVDIIVDKADGSGSATIPGFLVDMEDGTFNVVHETELPVGTLTEIILNPGAVYELVIPVGVTITASPALTAHPPTIFDITVDNGDVTLVVGDLVVGATYAIKGSAVLNRAAFTDIDTDVPPPPRTHTANLDGTEVFTFKIPWTDSTRTIRADRFFFHAVVVE